MRVAPEFSDAFMTLFRAYSILRENHQTGKSDVDGLTAAFSYDEVRDWVQSKLNHFDALDRAAEELFHTAKFDSANLIGDLKK